MPLTGFCLPLAGRGKEPFIGGAYAFFGDARPSRWGCQTQQEGGLFLLFLFPSFPYPFLSFIRDAERDVRA